jgi:hypothetical protein
MIGWLERGGPLVAAPKRKGFGSRLIDHCSIGNDLEGVSYAEFRHEGIWAAVPPPAEQMPAGYITP